MNRKTLGDCPRHSGGTVVTKLAGKELGYGESHGPRNSAADIEPNLFLVLTIATEDEEGQKVGPTTLLSITHTHSDPVF